MSNPKHNNNTVVLNKKRFTDTCDDEEIQTKRQKLKPVSLLSLSEQDEQSNFKQSTALATNHSKQNSNPQSTANQPEPNDLLSFHDKDKNKENSEVSPNSLDSNFPEVLGELGQEAKMILLQYSQSFRDSQLYEQQSVQAIQDLTEHAQMLEQQLQMQKEMLCSRLKTITKHLKTEV